MKTLVVYYSRTGNTKLVATEIAKILNADIDEIVDAVDRSGAKGWILAGRDAARKKSTDIAFKLNPADYDLIILGTPIWAYTVTPAIRTYMTLHKASLKKVAFYSTSGGGGIDKTFKEMELLSKKPVAILPLISKGWKGKLDLNKDDNLDKIKRFCDRLGK